MRLCYEHPQEACRPCSDCKKYIYDERGQRIKDGKGFAKRPTPPNCSQCPKMKEVGGDPSRRVLMITKLYTACKTLRVLPAPGGLVNQERVISRIFMELASIDCFDDRAFKEASLRARATGI